MEFQDRLSILKVRKLADGRIAAVARFARSGVQQYAGSEVGRPDLAVVNVYRPEEEVFSQDAMASFAHKAITLDHPSESVTAKSWRKVSVGYTEGRVARDGGFVEIPLMLADFDAVKAYESGKARELSAGYASELVWGDGVTPAGEKYQAKMTKVRGNHIALVSQGRAGSECRIGDAKAKDEPASIDEALRRAFAEMAERAGMKVGEMLASMGQVKIEEMAATVAKQFVSAQAGKGIATMYGDEKSAVHLAKSAANALRRDALAGGSISSGTGAQVRDLAHAWANGGPDPSAPRTATPAIDQASLAAGKAARDAARASQY